MTLEGLLGEQIGSTAGGLLAVFDAHFDDAGAGPFLPVEVRLGAPAAAVTTFANRTVDDDGIPAFLDPDLDEDGVLNGDDAFLEDPSESVDTDNDGVGDNIDPDDDNDGVPDVDDADPLDPAVGLDPDTDSDGESDSVDTDDDNDGVPDVDDAAPTDASVGTFLALTAPESALLRTEPGHLVDPSFATGTAKGALHEFDAGNVGELTTPNGSLPLDWTIRNGALEVVYSPGAEDLDVSFPAVSELVGMRLASQDAVDAFIETNGDLQIELNMARLGARLYLLEDAGLSQTYWVHSELSYQIVDDSYRTQLFGSIDAAGRAVTDEQQIEFLLPGRIQVISADDGSGLPFGAARVVLPVALDALADPG